VVKNYAKFRGQHNCKKGGRVKKISPTSKETVIALSLDKSPIPPSDQLPKIKHSQRGKEERKKTLNYPTTKKQNTHS